MDWQPIETHPHEGDFLAWSSRGYALVVAFDRRYGFYFSQDGEFDGYDFTHWAEIKPPQSA